MPVGGQALQRGRDVRLFVGAATQRKEAAALRRDVRLLLVLAFALAGCRTVVTPLRPDDFTGSLDRAFLRASSAELSDEAFDAKWNESKGDPVSFFRSFPGAFHADLARLPSSRIPGREVLCTGDAHPENFGYQRVNGKTVYALNDFDDSGYCPAAVDALRYFTVLRLGGSEAWLDALLEAFVSVAHGKTLPVPVDAEHTPDWDVLKKKGLAKSTQGDALNLASDRSLSATPPVKREAVEKALQSSPLLKQAGLNILDVATYTRISGGSGGLERYWVLAEIDGDRTLLELKQTVDAGVAQGRHERTLQEPDRLLELQRAFWSDVSKTDYFSVQLDGKHYLVRDRLTKTPLWPNNLTPKQLQAVLRTQAGQLGAIDAPGLKDVAEVELTQWLRESSATVAARWRALMQSLTATETEGRQLDRAGRGVIRNWAGEVGPAPAGSRR
ncbi:MAG: DUF2252 family protein [Myxococcaceae bacterium]